MKKSTFLGSVVSVLLAFSVISSAQAYVQQQDPKPVQQTNQTANIPANTGDVNKPEAPAQPADSRSALTEPTANTRKAASPYTEVLTERVTVAAQSYTATAYSLRGRTASGKPVARGLIAADPRILPIGTRVLVEAGPWSGEYVVADTGGLVKGRRIDIWTPSTREAMRFGRRPVKLTVLEFGGKRGKNASVRPRMVNSAPASSPTDAQKTAPEK